MTWLFVNALILSEKQDSKSIYGNKALMNFFWPKDSLMVYGLSLGTARINTHQETEIILASIYTIYLAFEINIQLTKE